jgi:hypothetical protein
MKKIEKLTYEQEKELKTTLEKWLEIGRSTKRIDRIKSANAIKALYKVNGKQEPFIWFCDSPYQCLFIIHLLKSNLGNNLWINLENNLWINLENNLRSNLRNNLGSNLRDNLENNLENNLWNNLWSNLGNNLRDKIWNNLRDNHLVDAKINFENYFGGSQWCGWKVFYDFCNKIGVQYSKKDKEILSLWMEEASECYWWFPFERIVFLSDRPTTLNLNKYGQLHHNTEPAMVFADGYSLYYMNGVNVPSWIIENPEEITEEKIKEEDDENIKQIMLNRIGFGRDKTILNNIYNLLES